MSISYVFPPGPVHHISGETRLAIYLSTCIYIILQIT